VQRRKQTSQLLKPNVANTDVSLMLRVCRLTTLTMTWNKRAAAGVWSCAVLISIPGDDSMCSASPLLPLRP
jgi:hypothetical protein